MEMFEGERIYFFLIEKEKKLIIWYIIWSGNTQSQKATNECLQFYIKFMELPRKNITC